MPLLSMTIYTVLLYIFKIKEPTRQEIISFFFKKFKNETFKIFKMFWNNMKFKFTRAVFLKNLKFRNSENSTTVMIFLCCY